MACSSALFALGGPGRLARLAGVIPDTSGATEAVAVHRAPPPPRGSGTGLIAQGMAYTEVARRLGGDGEPLPAAPRWTGTTNPGEATYRWQFADGSDATVGFAHGKLVWFTLFSVKTRG